MGCMGRRSPGRSGGRLAAAPGRGRWKIGCPGTGRPGVGRGAELGAPAEAAGDAVRGGALYTGRGPVCGTIMRGRDDCAVCVGAAGLLAAGAGGVIAAAGGCGTIVAGDAPSVVAAGEDEPAGRGRGGAGIAGGADAAGGCGAAGGGTVKVGLGVAWGTTNRGVGAT